MSRRKNKVVPMIITVFIIVIIIYLFVNLEQPYIECSKTTTNDIGIQLQEVLVTQLDNNRIDDMELTRTIILPDAYLDDPDRYLNMIEFALEESYQYLGKDKVQFIKREDRLIATIHISDDETIILNNLEIFDNDGLEVKINPNTKSSDVVTLKIGDSYTEGEFMTHLKNNGYVCK